MESKINYTLVGLFVVLLTAGLIIFAYWLGKNGGNQNFDRYYVYMSESVAGLSTDASVKYRGVNVGTVKDIDINPHNSEQVELLLLINRGTPIKEDTKAKLQSFGITGLTFIELVGSSKNAPLIKHNGDQIPIIPATPSTYAQIDESLRELAIKSAIALDKFDRLLSDENLDNMSKALAESQLLVQEIRGKLPGIMKAVAGAVIMEEQVCAASNRVEEASSSVKKMSDMLTKNYASTGDNISRDLHHSLKSFNQLTYELELLSSELRNTVYTIASNPSDLLFKRSTPRPGPGEDGYNEK
ncbi:MAG: hypothetical protein B6I36_08325 [Desulfobacteraceae bacterium 4572_35.1]|nr:MAG: hypothetical protein B6I36_08325 [Desulfobacteraceae bacterium 4572_35.1]